MEWNYSYSVYIKEIDDQHKKLFELIDNFQQNLRVDKTNVTISNMIGELKEYAKYHFRTEEGWMIRYNFPKFKNHQKSHHQFINKINEFEVKSKAGKLLLPSEISKYLKDWIVQHLTVEDKVYAHYLKHNNLI